jgi:hypothetical protein
MYTEGPAISLFTLCSLLPQKEQPRIFFSSLMTVLGYQRFGLRLVEAHEKSRENKDSWVILANKIAGYPAND